MKTIDVSEIQSVLDSQGMIPAIKLARDMFNLPLVTAKVFVEVIAIIDGRLTCPKCHGGIDPHEMRIPRTVQVRREG